MKKIDVKRAAQKGFTLIELVIVIVVIGILAAVAIPNFTGITDDAGTAATAANTQVNRTTAAVNAACNTPGANVTCGATTQ